nr:MAG TPA: crystallin beta/gamma motif-containing protein [Caudoviricetes sp.]
MAFDREGYSEYVGELNRQKEEQESPAPAEEKPSFWALLTDPATYQKGQELANEATLESNEAAGNILSETAQAVGEAVSSIPDAYGRLMAQEQAITAAYTPDKVEEANETGDYSEQQQAVETLQEEGSQFGQSLWETAGAFTRPLRERIGAVEDDAAENGSESAQNMRDTSTFIDYFMSDEQKLSKARQIEALTGIPADAALADTQAMKSALEVYDYAKKQKAVLGDAPWSMDAVWQEYPELRNIADMSPQDAALALHQIDEVRRTHGIIDSWQTMLEYGNKELEYGNLQYKIMQGKADENDMARAAQLEEQLKNQKKTLPSVFDDPLAAIVGGVASSTPMMYQSFVEAGQDAAAWTLAASAAGAGAGSVLPGAGTAAGALAGGVTGATRFAYLFLSNLARYSSGASFARTMGETGAKLGMLEGVRRPTVGQDYAEYKEMEDAEGNPLLTDEQAKDYATVAGTLNAGIEMANFGIALRALKGAPHTHKMLADIIKGATERQTAQESLRLFAMDRGADVLKVTASEAGEEGLQSVSDDLVHNKIEADTGDTSNGVYSFRDIAARGLQSSLEALPASFGFGVLSSFGGTVTGGIGKNIAMRDRARFEARYSKEERETLMGSAMYEQLQQAVAQSNVKEENKDIQRKVIRQQLANTKFSTVYVETETALEKENGMDDLKAVAKAANISDEDLQTAIDEKGTLTVPGEQFAQAASSPDLLESVSFSPEADSIARMRKDAKATLAAMEEREKASISRQMNLQQAILDEYYPEEKAGAETMARREALQAVMMQNPENPAQGWNDVRKEYRARLDELLAPALRALKEGMGKGGQYMETEDENGNKKTLRFTENAEWYRNFYQIFGRKPTAQELEDMAIALTTGDESAPKVEGFIPTTKEEADGMAAMKPEIEDLKKKIATLDDIKQEARQLNGVEMELTEGLSKDGFHVYRTVMHQLQDVGGAPARAARMDAILFARHADIVADIISKKTGKKYTALDYMRERYGLETGEKHTPEYAEYAQSAMYRNPADTLSKFIDNAMQGKSGKSYFDYDVNGYKVRITSDDVVHVQKGSHPLSKQDWHKILEGMKNGIQKAVLSKQAKRPRGESVALKIVTPQKMYGVAVEFANGSLIYIRTAFYSTDKNLDAWMKKNKREAGVRRYPGFPSHTAEAGSNHAITASHSLSISSIQQALGIDKRFSQMAGERALTANQQALVKAQEMETAGKDADEIWEATGWLKGKDDRWRFEIPDNLDKINFSPLFHDEYHIAKLKDVYDNPKLYKAYPALGTRSVQLADLDDKTRGFVEVVRYPSGRELVSGIKLNEKFVESEPDKIKETLVHEVQHVIQTYENFARGGSVDFAGGEKNYLRLAGEQEARETATRAVKHTETVRRIDEQKRRLSLKQKELDHVLEEASEEEKADYAAYGKAYADFDGSENAGDVMASIEKKNWKSVNLRWGDIYMLEWNIADDEEGLDARMPKPHSYDAIVTFDGEEVASFNQEKNRGAKGYITPYSDGRRVITLLEEADESTFLHEMSHMFLMDLEDLAQIDEVSKKELELVDAWANWEKGAAKEYKGTPWEREFRKREQGIIDAKAAGDHDTADRLKRQWRQERFARAFELYLREGKAPARGLRAVFRKFKQFLRVIYEAFAGDGGHASLPVQRVMARMIATEEEIEEMSLDDRYKDVTKAGGEKLLDEDDAETYARWREEAIAEAKEKLMKIVMKDLTEKKEREFEERVKRERERKRRELQNEPVYLATQAVAASGGDENIVKNWYGSVEEYLEEASKVPPIEEALDAYMEQYTRALDEELVESHLSEEAVRAAMDSSEYADKLQSLISTAFAKKQALIRTITTKTQRAMQSIEDKLTALPEDVDLKLNKTDEAVKDIMQAINRLRFSAKWKPEDYAAIENMIHAATKEELRNELKKLKEAKRVDEENEEAVREANKGRMKIYRDIAEKAMKTKTVAEIIDVRHYRNEIRRLAARVQQMIKAKRWDMAMQAQQQMGLAAAMWKQAVKAREDVMKRLDRIKKQLKARSVRLPKDERYWHRHLAYILRITKTDAKEPESGHISLQELFTNMEQSLDIQGAPEGIFDLAAQGDDFRGWSSLKYDELKQALDALTMIYTTGRDKFRMKTIGGKDIEEVVDEICAGGGDADGIKTREKKVEENEGGLGYNDWIAKVPGVGRLIARQGKGFLAAMMKPEEVLRALGPAAHRYLYGIYEKAAQEEGARIEQEYKTLKGILSGYSHSEKRAWKEKKYTFQTGAGKELWSKENIICAALNLGTKTNVQRLAGGLDVDAQDVRDFINEHMTKKDWTLVQDLWDHISSYWEETVAVEEKLNGVALEKTKAVPFDVTLPDGETLHMKGGYYPIKFNAEKSGKAAEQENNAAAMGAMSGAQALGTRRGFTKSRSEYDVYRPLLLEFSVIPKHLQDVIHNITYRVPARDVYRLVASRKVEEYVAGTLGREYYNVLKEWATDAWNILPGAENIAERKVDLVFGALRRNSVMAIMGYRIWPVIENASNIGPVMDKLGAANGLAAVADFYAHYDEAKKLLYKSVFMRNRINSMDRDIGRQEGMFQADARPFEIIRSHAYDLMLYSDLALSAPLWVRAYKDAYARKVAEVKRENEEAIQAVLKAQKDVEDIRARILDLSLNISDINQHLDVRKHGTAEDIEAARSSPFAVRTEEELREEVAGNTAEIKELKKKRYEAEATLQKATERDTLTDEEVLKEAERRAIAQADAAIRDTFGSGQTQDLSSIQRQRGELYKLMTTFYSFFNTQFNAIFAAYRHGKFGLKGEGMIKRWAPFARAVFYRLVVMSIIGSMLKFALGVDGSDDKDKYRKVKNPQTGKEERVEVSARERFLRVFGNNLLSTATGSFVGVRDIANLAITYLFDGTTYGRGINPISTAFKPFEELGKAVDLLARKGKKDLEIEEQHAKKRQEQQKRLKKLRGKARQEYLKKIAEEEKYKHPDQHITYSEIARHGLNAASTLTAAHTGITNTLMDAITGTMQYMNDTDNRYEGGWNIVWSAVFDKKPVEREIPKKPEPAPETKKDKRKKKK